MGLRGVLAVPAPQPGSSLASPTASPPPTYWDCSLHCLLCCHGEEVCIFRYERMLRRGSPHEAMRSAIVSSLGSACSTHALSKSLWAISSHLIPSQRASSPPTSAK